MNKVYIWIKGQRVIILCTFTHLSYGQRPGQEVGPVLVGVCLTEPGQREGEAGGEQEHRVYHRKQDHQSGHGQVITGVWWPLLPVECPLVLRAGEVENTESKCSLVNWMKDSTTLE